MQPNPLLAIAQLRLGTPAGQPRDHVLLLDYLRQCVGLTGTKEGCDGGECGACTVLINGEPRLACITLAASVEGDGRALELTGTVALHGAPLVVDLPVTKSEAASLAAEPVGRGPALVSRSRCARAPSWSLSAIGWVPTLPPILMQVVEPGI